MTAVAVGLGLARTSCYEGLLMKIDDAHDPSAHLPIRVAAAGAIVVGVIGALTGWLLGLPEEVNLTIALSSAVVMMFDGLRFTSFLLKCAGAAVRADLWWFLGTAAGLLILIGADALTPAKVAIVYASACATGSLWFLPLRRQTTRLTSFRPQRSFADLRFGLDYLLQVAPAYVALIAGGAVASLAAIGELRAALIVFSPLGSAIYAIRLAILRPDQAETRGRTIPRSAVVYGTVSAVYGAVVLGLFTAWPDELSASLATISIGILAYVAIGEVGRFASQGFIDENRKAGLLRPAIGLRGGQGIALVALSAGLAAGGGAKGLGQARSIAYLVPLIAWFVLNARRSFHAPLEGDGAPPDRATRDSHSDAV